MTFQTLETLKIVLTFSRKIVKKISHTIHNDTVKNTIGGASALVAVEGKASSTMASLSLAVFDFDRTIVDDDSDATIIRKLKEKETPPQRNTNDWTPYMNDVFEHAFTAGLSQEDILEAISSMRPTPGVEELISGLHSHGWHVVLITDANSVFVRHWLKTHDLERCVKQVITNRGFWQQGRLYIEPCQQGSECPRCPSNLCKSLALAQWCEKEGPYDRIVYIGDGRNDYCPATALPANGIVFPRRGYPLDNMIKKTLATSTPQVLARVVPWDDCHAIYRELIPSKNN